MKKSLSVVLSIIMIFAMPTNSAALTNQEATATNEYEAMQQLSKNSDKKLQSMGYNDDDIEAIKNYEDIYDEHIKNLSTLKNSTLSEHGYTAEQIRIIKTSDFETKSTMQKSRASAECKTYSTISNYTGTRARITTDFTWIGVPAFKMTDIFTTVWNNWYIIDKAASIKYVSLYNSNDTFGKIPTYKKQDSGLESFGAGYTFRVSERDNYYSKSGRSVFTLGCVSRQHLETAGRVGHQQGVSPLSFSIRGMNVDFKLQRVSLGYGHDDAGK